MSGKNPGEFKCCIVEDNVDCPEDAVTFAPALQRHGADPLPLCAKHYEVVKGPSLLMVGKPRPSAFGTGSSTDEPGGRTGARGGAADYSPELSSRSRKPFKVGDVVEHEKRRWTVADVSYTGVDLKRFAGAKLVDKLKVPWAEVFPAPREARLGETTMPAHAAAFRDKEHVKSFLTASGRKYLVMHTPDLIDALPFPEGVELVQQIIAAYGQHRAVFPSGWVGSTEGTKAGPIPLPPELPIMKDELPTMEEIDEAIAQLTALRATIGRNLSNRNARKA